MAADETGDHVRHAIDWFAEDRSRTRQTIARPTGPIAPGQLLEAARFDVQVNRLLDRRPAGQAQALVRAQAAWLIRRMPGDHQPPALDSAQQAGRAWGILITSDTSTETLPDRDVLTEVAARTKISPRAAHEIRRQARGTSAAYNRADLLVPYDDVPEEVLAGDWNRLVACGPELPEAAARAQDVLDLLTARTTGTEEHAWMDTAAQHAAQVYAGVIRAQPLLASLAAVIPGRDRPGAAGDQARLVELARRGRLATAATAAARARAVQEWAGPGDAATPDRTRTVEAAGPGMRTLMRLNEALAALDAARGPSAFTAPDAQRLAQITEAIRRLSAKVATDLRPTGSLPAARGQQPAPPHPRHPHPPPPGQSPGGSTPRTTP